MVVIRNTFNSGLYTDFRPEMQPDGSYSYALNAVNKGSDNSYAGVLREESNKLSVEIEGTAIGTTYIDEENATLIFVKNGSSSEIHIFYHDTEELKFIAADSEFNCEWNFDDCEWIEAETTKLEPCRETIIYFSSKCTYYRINITELLDPVRKKSLIESISPKGEQTCDEPPTSQEEIQQWKNACQNCDGYTCDYFKLIKGGCGPRMSVFFSESGGYSLTAGSYRFAARLRDNEGNETNWSWISDQINVTSENNIPGEISRGKIKIILDGLDCRYDAVEIAAIHELAGTITAQVIGSKHYNSKNVTFEYYGQKGREISIEEIVTKKKKWIKGKDLIQKDGRLWLYNIKDEKNVNYQRRALEADLYWVEYETTATSAKKYQYRSLMRDENYLFGIVLNYIDGTHSNAFLLAPKGSCGASPGIISGTGDNFTPLTGDIEFDEKKYYRLRGDGEGGSTVTGGGCSGGNCKSTDTQNGDSYPAGDQDAPDNPNDPSGAGSDPAEEMIDNWDTESDQFSRSAACNECAEDEIASRDDMSDFELLTAKHLNELSEAGQDKDNPNLNKATTFKDAGKALIEDGVKKAEFVQEKAAKITSKDGGNSLPSGNGDAILVFDGPIGGDPNASTRPNSGSTAQVHNEIVGEGDVQVTEELPRAVKWGSFGVTCTTNKYPDAKDCDGEAFFGDYANQFVRLFKTPDLNLSPIVASSVKGVVNQFQPDNNEFENTYIRHLGLGISNVQLPTQDELPKPLCPNQPYRIVMVPRDQMNSTIIAKGISTSCFLSEARGTQYMYPRLGVNSICAVDRMVDRDGNRVATDEGNPNTHYNFHSLDTRTEHIGLGANSVNVESVIYGWGWKHGLYAKGREPQDKMYGRRTDQRGYRGAVNLNQFDTGTADEVSVEGITYAPAHSVVNNPKGIEYPLMNMFRESSVYYATDQPLPGLTNNRWGGASTGGYDDTSFFTDTADHFGPINGAAGWYTSLRRDIPDQYGAVEGMRFIDTGLVARGKTTSIQGLMGDIFIGPDTFVRKSYVSNKVGNTFEDTPERPRTVCDNPDDKLMELTGINHYPSRLPESGDESDAKNWAGGYEFGRHTQVHEAAAAPTNDYYYPKVQKTLITYWGEFKYNPWTRQTSPGSQKELGEVYYPNLKDMYLDSDAPNKHPWEESFLNKFYYEVEQPSKAQLLRKALIRNIVTIILPALGIETLTDLENYIDTTGFFVGLPVLVGLWWLSQKVLARNDYLDKLLGLPECRTDDEGGDFDDQLRDFNDNFDENSLDFSWDGSEQNYHSMVFPYNTCVCDDCEEKDETTNEIFFSAKHRPGMIIDAYKNFNSFDFTEIPNHSGKIRNLFINGGNLYAHTTEQIYLIKYRALTTQTNMSSALLGGNELLIDPQPMGEGVPEGHAGLLDTNATLNCPIGYVWIDREAGKVYLFADQIREISNIGNFHWFKQNIPFCEIGDCVDERTVDGAYFALGWDNRYNRLLVTKKDGNSNASWTMSFDPYAGERGQGAWVSAHSYLPQAYMSDRYNLFTLKDNKIWKHHVEGNYGNFYGELHPHVIEFTAKHNTTNDIDYISTELYTQAEVLDSGFWVKGLDKTFDHIAVWNRHQGTGTLRTDLVSDNKGQDESIYSRIEEKSGIVKLFKESSRWNMNEIHNYRKRDCREKPLLIKSDSCQPFYDINESIFDCDSANKSDFENQRLTDTYLTYRLTYTGPEDVRLMTNMVDTKIEEPDTPQK